MRSRLNIILMVEETPGLPHLGKPTITSHWLTGVEIKQQPKFSLEASTVLMLEGVDEELKSTKTVQTYPCGLLESVSVGRKKMERRRETEKIGDRPQLVRAKSLEDQMLEQAGYGVEGQCSFLLSIGVVYPVWWSYVPLLDPVWWSYIPLLDPVWWSYIPLLDPVWWS